MYRPGLRGLFTETNSQDAGESTLKVAENVNVNQDGKVESRHGLNRSFFTSSNLVANDFRYDISSMSVFKLPHKTSLTGKNWQYVILNDQSVNVSNVIVSVVEDNLTENPTFEGVTAPYNVDLEKKPVAFNFDQSFYISTPRGWVQNHVENFSATVPTNNYKIINWPNFTNIHVEPIQDTYDFSKNWLGNDSKLGVRLTYLWNARYNDEEPRIIESAPSQEFEVYHMISKTTYTGINTVQEFSKIRVLVGYNPTDALGGNQGLANYGPDYAGGRSYAIRVYRTKSVGIRDRLPPDYRQAAQDVAITDPILVNDATSGPVNFITDSGKVYLRLLPNIDVRTDKLKSGMPIVFKWNGTPLIAGINENQVYYLGENLISAGPGWWTIMNTPYSFNTPLVISSLFNLVYTWRNLIEIELSVNDDALLELPPLYTNIYEDGTQNSNMIPPIAESVENYKGYTIAGNIRDPLRAYTYLIAQPLTREVSANISVNGSTKLVSGQTVLDSEQIIGFSNLEFAPDTALLHSTTPSGTSINFTTGVAQFSGTISVPNTLFPAIDVDYVAKTTLYKFTETVSFKVKLSNDVTEYTITAPVLPEYNRCAPYQKLLDRNDEWLQYSGNMANVGVPMALYMPPAPPTSNVRGTIPAPIYSAANDITISATSLNPAGAQIITISAAISKTFDIASFLSPGLLVAVDTAGYPQLVMSYQSYINKSTAGSYIVEFVDVNIIHNGGGAPASAIYYVSGSSFATAPLYMTTIPNSNYLSTVFDTNVVSDDGFSLDVPFIPVSLVPANGMPTRPIGNTNASSLEQYFYRMNSNTITLLTLLLPNAQMNGLTRLSPALLLDKAASNLVARLNNIVTDLSVGSPALENVKFIKGADVGEIIVEVYGGEYIKGVLNGNTAKFEPNITGQLTTLVEYKENLKNAIAISRLATPEAFPASQVLSPFRLGNENKRVMSIVKNADECYILKEDGIWQLRISSQEQVPEIDAVVQIDTTTYTQVENAAKELNEEIIFLSQKGFMSISGSSVQPIGKQIETRVKTDLQEALGAGLGNRVRAWVNEQKRIYGCTIWKTLSSFTTYVFNTYTREWTTWDIPIIDAVTDENGRTLYLIAERLGEAGIVEGFNFVNLRDFGTVNYQSNLLAPRWSLAEEIHTSGLDRNEADQWDYYYKPFAINFTPGVNEVFFESHVHPHPLRGMDDLSPSSGHVGASKFLRQKGYYRFGTIYYPITFLTLGENPGSFMFDNGLPVNFSSSLAGANGLYAGVNAATTLNPTGFGTPDTNKQFSEYHVHTEEAVSTLTLNFSTDSRSSFTSDRTYAYNPSAVNRTVYRTYIPVEASRGRWFIRRIVHSVPGERFIFTGQTHIIRDLNSTRTQKNRGA